MSYTTFWTAFAETKLDELHAFYKEEANIAIANDLVNNIIDASIQLENNPYLGRAEHLLEDRPEYFRFIIYRHFKILYWVNELKNRIEVVHVFDTRQSPHKLFYFAG